MAGLGRGFEFFFGTYPEQKYDTFILFYLYLFCFFILYFYVYILYICIYYHHRYFQAIIDNPHDYILKPSPEFIAWLQRLKVCCSPYYFPPPHLTNSSVPSPLCYLMTNHYSSGTRSESSAHYELVCGVHAPTDEFLLWREVSRAFRCRSGPSYQTCILHQK